ncbi:tripartite tricarboxylate transporter substrate binding protein [Bradyrhizobium sp. 1]|uniref:tripartite tricarboxylate transporter substrate binding protein n=1 Tax=Bradyrhizobium sp. 1 TaxID=241591 RepID=UPI001FF94938|nr:tripartite tricarboxylate transporter substrate binding protein [Bradyrhizobium sp. 1]MCK1394492.1 tripartite tricarboxylate transporter substrate binding protein [Bradyrhizobium sp. 1]
MIVPFAAGGTADVLGRIVAQELGTLTGNQIIVENRPGSGGNIGADAVARGPADGSVLLLGTIGIHAASKIYKSLPYDPNKDLRPVTILAEVPNVLIVHPSVAAKDVKEFLALAREKPGALNFGSAGNGSSTHMIAELFKLKAKVDLTHVPYRGSAPALNDLVAGQIQLMVENLPTALPFIESGTVRALGVTSATRSPSLPSLPTIAEAGVPGYDATAWFTIAVAGGVPPATIEKLNADIRKILAEPEVIERFKKLGAAIVGNRVADAKEFVASETAKWNNVIEAAQIRID